MVVSGLLFGEFVRLGGSDFAGGVVDGGLTGEVLTGDGELLGFFDRSVHGEYGSPVLGFAWLGSPCT